MSEVLAGFVTSHATGLIEPARWDHFRGMVRDRYAERFGSVPPEQPEVDTEDPDDNERRYAAIRDVQDLIADRLAAIRPDAVLLFGNDQNENFRDTVPQFAIHTGDEVVIDDYINKQEITYRGSPDIARAVLGGCLDRGFDVAQVESFSGGKLTAHAHSQVFARMVPSDVPVIPIFVNAITPPLPPVSRCFSFGRAIAESIAADLPGKRLVIGASGGLSHFTSGYPFEALTVERSLGMICADFDRQLLEWIEKGDLSRIAEVSDVDIVNNGDVEFRQAITFFGALADGSKPERLEYEPFYRGLMGFWAGYWDLGR